MSLYKGELLMKEPIKIMLLGISIIMVSLFIQNIEPGSPSSLVQIIMAVGFITTLVGFFYKKT